MKKTQTDNIELLETRIELLKQDSRMCSFRIDYHEQRRARIQKEIRDSKLRIKKIRGRSKI